MSKAPPSLDDIQDKYSDQEAAEQYYRLCTRLSIVMQDPLLLQREVQYELNGNNVFPNPREFFETLMNRNGGPSFLAELVRLAHRYIDPRILRDPERMQFAYSMQEALHEPDTYPTKSAPYIPDLKYPFDFFK